MYISVVPRITSPRNAISKTRLYNDNKFSISCEGTAKTDLTADSFTWKKDGVALGNHYTKNFVQDGQNKEKWMSSLVFNRLALKAPTLASVKALDGDYTCVVSDGEKQVESDVIRVDTMCKYYNT